MNKLFADQVRKKHSNKCFECGAKHGMKAVKSAGGQYHPVEENDRELAWFKNQNIVSVYLKVLPLDYSNNELLMKNFAPFCPYHAQQHMKEQIRKIKASDEHKSKGISVNQVVEVKNWFHNSYGFRPSTKDIVFLWQYFEKAILK
jgi:hypothetical protein